jgi:tRNA pseudouridine synthase 10
MAEELKESGPMREALDFITSLPANELSFLVYFLTHDTCFRCSLMLFSNNTLSVYRIQDYEPIYKHLNIPFKPSFTCSLC